jgi:hypothetical protein
MDPQAVLALCQQHAVAEAEFDIDRVLATLVPVPRYEFFPLAKWIEGWTNIERFYRDQYPRFVSQVVGYELLGEWTNEHAALQEYVIELRGNDGRTTTYHVMSAMPVDEEVGLLSGERLYCDQAFVRKLLGPLYHLLEPAAGSWIRPRAE